MAQSRLSLNKATTDCDIPQAASLHLVLYVTPKSEPYRMHPVIYRDICRDIYRDICRKPKP